MVSHWKMDSINPLDITGLNNGTGVNMDASNEVSVVSQDLVKKLEYLSREYEFWGPTEKNVEVKPYCYDDRIDWFTYLVTIDGKAALFTDGPI